MYTFKCMYVHLHPQARTQLDSVCNARSNTPRGRLLGGKRALQSVAPLEKDDQLNVGCVRKEVHAVGLDGSKGLYRAPGVRACSRSRWQQALSDGQRGIPP